MSTNPPNVTLSLAEIEAKAKNYSGARELLADRLQQLQQKIDALKREAMPLLRTALQATKAAESELSNALLLSPQHFKKPRTVVFHGVKVGYEKGKGKLVLQDDARTISLIRKHLPDQFDLLVQTTETPVKNALAQLSAAELKKIGGEITSATDKVVIRPVDDELDKAIKALLKAEDVEADTEPDSAI